MKKTRVDVICQYPPCSKTFSIKLSGLARGQGRFCSYVCKGLGTRIDPTERFWSFVEKTSHCWLWTGASLTAGYGTFGISGRTTRNTLAHRYSWELAFGPIPDGLFVLHNCAPLPDNPACVNPAHLFLGTDIENSDDKCQKQRQARGEMQGGAKLTPALIYEIRSLQGRMTPSKAGEHYQLSPVTIWRIWKRLTWKHLPELP